MKLRTCLVGAQKTGKSHFVSKLKKYPFHQYHETIGVDFCSYRTGTHEINIWDTSGSERFQSITTNFVHNVNIVLCLYKDKASAKWIQTFLNSHQYPHLKQIIFIYHDKEYPLDTDIENYSIKCNFTEDSVLECIDFIIKVNQKDKDRSYCFW